MGVLRQVGSGPFAACTEHRAVVREAAIEHERDPDSIELSLLGAVGFTTADDVERAAQQGANRLVLGTLIGDLRQPKDEMSCTADALIHR